MRARGFLLLIAAVLAVSVQAQALPAVSAVGVALNGSSIVLSKGKSLVVGSSGAAVPINAKVTCLKISTLTGVLITPGKAKRVEGRAIANGKNYYFWFIGMRDKAAASNVAANVMHMLYLNVSTKPGFLGCNANSKGYSLAAGIVTLP